MDPISITEFRNHLPAYLKYVHKGEEIKISSRGHVIARVIPEKDLKENAKTQLKALRKTAFVGDIISPLNETWSAMK